MDPAIHDELETVYARLRDGGYLSALDALSRLLPSGDDRAVTRAIDIFLDEFFRHDHSESPLEAQILEKLLLLDRSGRIELDEERREEVVLRLVRMHDSEPDLAVSYARFLPDHPSCRTILEEAGPAASSRLSAAGASVAVHRIGSAGRDPEREPVTGRLDGLRSLYRSDLERRFHLAVMEVFPHFLAVPNVALQAIVHFESIRHRLTDSERAYFFKGMIDVVVFDPQRELHPNYLFELDSPYHDDPKARERDEMKNRIVEAAGARLYRLRPADRKAEPAVFVAALRRITRQD